MRGGVRDGQMSMGAVITDTQAFHIMCHTYIPVLMVEA